MIDYIFCLDTKRAHDKQDALRLVRSASYHPNLRGWCVYVNSPSLDVNPVPKEDDFCKTLKQIGINVVLHTPDWTDLYRQNPFWRVYGTMARVDYPRLWKDGLLTSQPHYLCIDTDAVFLQDPTEYLLRHPPRSFWATSEVEQKRMHYFNAGVMWCNAEWMWQSRERLKEAVVEKLPLVGGYQDQALFNSVYGCTEWQWMDLEMNWKPYWGRNSKAIILHWHGPKYHECLQMIESNFATRPPGYAHLIHEHNIASYKYWHEYCSRKFDAQ